MAPCGCLGKQAENCAKYLSKGRQVYVEGKLQTRQWEDQQGQKKYSTEVVAQNVQFLVALLKMQQQQAHHKMKVLKHHFWPRT